jgi:membrane protein implicated in regulation of membrane protease activity
MTDTTTSQDQEKQLEAKMPERPLTVQNAIGMLYASLVLGALNLAYVILQYKQNPLYGMQHGGNDIGSIIFGLLVTWFLIVKISKGKNWARLVFAVLFVLGAVVVVPAIALLYAAMPISALITGLQTLLQFIGVVLLFVPSSNAWFRAVKESKRAIKEQQRIQKAAQ